MAGKYTVNARGAQGVQVGDHNRQDNVFNAPAGGAGSAVNPGLARGSGTAARDCIRVAPGVLLTAEGRVCR